MWQQTSDLDQAIGPLRDAERGDPSDDWLSVRARHEGPNTCNDIRDDICFVPPSRRQVVPLALVLQNDAIGQ
jgi:hypothetical protein